jgi:hypothetical protein
MARTALITTGRPGKASRVLRGSPALPPHIAPDACRSPRGRGEAEPGYPRNGRKNARTSSASASGSSIAAKWPPRDITVQRWRFV